MKMNSLSSLKENKGPIDILRSRLGCLIARKTFLKKTARPGKPQSFSGFVGDASSFLIVMPDGDEDFGNALEFADTIRKKGKKVSLLAKEDKLSDLIQTKRFRYIKVNPSDKTRLELPNKKFALMLRREKYDVVIDLNIPENTYCSVAANLVNSKFRIGFMKRHSDRFYNMQIANNEINSALSYRNLLNSLQMF
ncbi:MAG: hypothetical protein HF314_03070 [Ignavibacteria bacterium]|jgi:hypothetical protein|nr:hypothetical protein [Ignavibacteria bacterium]MCU7502031.1 hypothetical protein [Ignavibacteria bacterium]MCU7516999.1 hypothetical protein [Ignavibacteria bacterium]